MKSALAKLPSPKANCIGDDRASAPNYDARGCSAIVPYDGITVAEHDYDGLDQHATPTACSTIPTLVHLAASDQFFSESVFETPMRIAANPINFTDPYGTYILIKGPNGFAQNVVGMLKQISPCFTYVVAKSENWTPTLHPKEVWTWVGANGVDDKCLTKHPVGSTLMKAAITGGMTIHYVPNTSEWYPATQEIQWDPQTKVNYLVWYRPPQIVYPSIGDWVIPPTVQPPDELDQVKFNEGMLAHEMIHWYYAQLRQQESGSSEEIVIVNTVRGSVKTESAGINNEEQATVGSGGTPRPYTEQIVEQEMGIAQRLTYQQQ